MSKITKRPKDPWYKKYSTLTPEEKRDEKYNRKGQPRLVWPTSILGTFTLGEESMAKLNVLYEKYKAEIDKQEESMQVLETPIEAPSTPNMEGVQE